MLKVDSAQLEFDGRKILRDVTLHCKRGEIVGMLGRNGSGKSTLLKVIFGTISTGYKYASIDDKVINKGYEGGKVVYLPQTNFLPRYSRVKKLADLMVASHYRDEFFSMPILSKPCT